MTMILDTPFTVRTVFAVDPKVIHLTISYSVSAGRNFDEILQLVGCKAAPNNHETHSNSSYADGLR